MNILTEKEKNIIRYYEGDVSGTDPFWSDPKAYLTINSLFFPGIENETARTDESKKLNSAFFDDDERTLDVLQTLFECGQRLISEKEITSFRVERYLDYRQMKAAGKTIGFTSTSTGGFLKQYSDRRGIALLEIRIMPQTPIIDMAAVLDHYAKAQEREILLLPQCRLEMREKPVLPEYMDIIDMDGNPPLIMAEVKVSGLSLQRPDEEDSGEIDRQSLYRVYETLNAHQKPDEKDVREYIRYKKQLMLQLYDRINKRA